ncbi:DUF4232 domain-containing protein [Pseudonocardia sp. GCM10023141]|uniref:DUF4232 domain-containing protein n=1 Tax=Pseudonocardia sp. GCM10023141 TaxID=3252653 RepID=UPI00360DB147
MNRNTTTARLAAAAAAVLLAAFAAGCSSGGSGGAVAPPPFAAPSSTAGSSTTSAAPVPSATPTAAPSPNGGASDPARCTTAELSGSLGPADAGAGSVYLSVVFTNKSNRTCTVHGFPGVSYVAGDDGHQVGPAAGRSGALGPAVSLKPGAAAAAKIQLANVHNFDNAACGYTPVRGLRVYPPDDTAAMYLPYETTGCAKTPPAPSQQLQVQTVQPG